MNIGSLCNIWALFEEGLSWIEMRANCDNDVDNDDDADDKDDDEIIEDWHWMLEWWWWIYKAYVMFVLSKLRPPPTTLH